MAQDKPIALFPPHLRAIAEALSAIFQDGFYADKVIERTLKADPRRGAGDRAFIAQNIYEIVRWYRLLYTLRGSEPRTENDWWEIIGIRYIIDGHRLPDWTEFKKLKPELIQQRYKKAKEQRAVVESIPDWLDELGLKELKEQWPPTLHALNRPAEVILRVNTLKGNAKGLVAALKKDNITSKVIGETSVHVIKRKALFRSAAFKAGLFEVQDFSSQQVAPFLDVAPGMRVIDACAGAGGKTLHLANLMDNKGQVIALDTESWKLNELRKRARRNGIHIVDTRPITSSKVIKRLSQSADRVLLDVPCSGLGVIRRNPDSKWKMDIEFIDRIKTVQQEILQSYSRMVKKDGKLVYATCSVLPSENQDQVQTFLASEKGQSFQLEEQRILLPQEDGYDGFFMARLGKK
ncbi:RsmB/NOP family class I SAM-dependent RNA methyltransferase [Lewinella cohaerens]|uniref:RsmB/NOP family class I SAM-dependent RNA methyltransferase n=1 Tax=Lewinella cohaerens TaxID=70995 RepID=UPI0003617ED7|nr:methyltransferase domain-containing protein [Lewinella cohaerens]